MQYCVRVVGGYLNMGRQRNGGRVFNLFKDRFKITFYHKPSMMEEDLYYVIILDDIIWVKLRVFQVKGFVLVIEDIKPLTTAYIPITYNKIVEVLRNQKEFTVLVCITGNITAFESSCIKVGAPIVEDSRFTNLPVKIYDRLKDYYNSDISKYGFYVLAVNEKQESQTEVKSINFQKTDKQNKPVEVVDIILAYIKDSFQKDNVSILNNEKDWQKGVHIDVKGILFFITFFPDKNVIGLHDFYLGEMQSYQDLMKLCVCFEKYNSEVTTILYGVSDTLLYNICEMHGYRRINDNSRAQRLSINHMYEQYTYGDYVIDRKII